jgi:alkylation response protein AidB-like acyl-CoA dehydrogenase
VRELAETDTGIDPTLTQTAELGWYALLVPEEHGGRSISGDSRVPPSWREAIQPAARPFVPMGVVDSLAEAGAAARQADVLAAIVMGETVAMRLRARQLRHGCRQVATSGAGFVSGTAVSYRARTSPTGCSSPPARVGLTQFLVPASASGVRIEKLDGLDQPSLLAALRRCRLTEAELVGEVDGAGARRRR